MEKVTHSWDEVFHLKPNHSLPTIKKVDEIIQKVFGINPSSELRSKINAFYEEISTQDLTPRETIIKFLESKNFFFKKEPDFKSLEVVILQEKSILPTSLKLEEILSYLSLLSKQTFSDKEKDNLNEKIIKIYSEGKIPNPKDFPQLINIQGEMNSLEDVVDAKKSYEIFIAKRDQKVKDLLLELKTSINENFISGKTSYIIAVDVYKKFYELESESVLKSFLSSLRSKKYYLQQEGENIKITIRPEEKDENIYGKFKKFVTNTFSSSKYNESDVKKFFKKEIENPTLSENELFLGVKDSGEYNIQNFIENPGAVFCGGMGSGKTVAARFTLATHILSHENSIVFILDPLKGAADYAPLFKLGRVIPFIHNPAYVPEVLKYIYEEMRVRKNLLSGSFSENINAYEKKTGKKLARIILMIEEFHSIPNSEYVKFPFMCDKPGSAANQLKEILRIGRSFGITVIAATQRATIDDFPSTLKPGFSNLLGFRINNPIDNYALNLPHSADIKMGQNGRAAIEGGEFVQFPYLRDEEIDEVINSLENKEKLPELVTMNSQFLKEIKENPENLLKNKKSTLEKSLIENKVSLASLNLILEFFGYNFESNLRKTFPIDLILQDNQGKKIGLMLDEKYVKNDIELSMIPLSKKALGLDEVWLISLESDIDLLKVRNSILKDKFSKIINADELLTIINLVIKMESGEEKDYFEEILNLMPLSQKNK